MNSSDIHQGHRDRVRARFRKAGADNFMDHELLELLLYYCNPQRDTNPLAHELIRRFGRLKDVLDASTKELTDVKHVGENTAFFLQLLPDICRRYYEQGKTPLLDFSADDCGASFFVPYFLGRKQEVMYAAFLNENFRVKSCSLQYTGTSSAVEIHLLDLLKEAKFHEACYVILAHNHFMDTTPSLQDIHCTKLAFQALQKENIVLLDHVIVCDSNARSMRQSGHMNFLKK